MPRKFPEPGAKFQSGAEDAGEIVSAVFSPALEKVVALAYIRSRFADPGTALLCWAISRQSSGNSERPEGRARHIISVALR